MQTTAAVSAAVVAGIGILATVLLPRARASSVPEDQPGLQPDDEFAVDNVGVGKVLGPASALADS